MSRPRKLRGSEALEARQMLAIVGVPWQDPRHLTFSFAPDGTPIAGHTSSLFEALGDDAPTATWQADIARALQTWAVAANLDFGVRSDSGQALGVAGKLQGDPRFGDLRFAAQAMDPSSIAIAVLHDPFLSGTLAGDVLFNSEVDFAAAHTTLFSVALHEIGHSLGLDDSTDPTSVMFEHVGNNLTTLGPSDIAAIRALYGWRAPDRFDQVQNNGSQSSATLLRFPADDDHAPYAGNTPLVAFGDVRNAYDVDFYELPPLANYSGPVSFRLQSSGISLLSPRLEIYDDAGQRIAFGEATSPLGNVVTLTLPEVDPSRSLFLRVSGATADVFGVGRYGLAITYESQAQPPGYVLDQLLQGPYDSLNEEEIQTLFEDPHSGYVREDYYDNETLATATVLTTTLGYAAQTHYEALGSVSMATDVDMYRVLAPSSSTGDNVLTATVADMPLNGAEVKIDLLDEQGRIVPSEILANGNGVYTVQARGLTSHGVYYLKVTGINRAPTWPYEPGPNPVGENLGNYTLTASFGMRAAEIETFAAGRINRALSAQSIMLYVAEDQLFHFLLSAQAGDAKGAGVSLRLYDDRGHLLLEMASRLGETTSAAAQHIYPGAYRMEIRRLSRGDIGPVEFTLRGGRLTKPVGPAIEDTTLDPLYRDGEDPTLFRYPGGVVSPDPVLFAVLPGAPVLGGFGAGGGGAAMPEGSSDTQPDASPPDVSRPDLAPPERAVVRRDVDTRALALRGASALSDRVPVRRTRRTDG